MNLINDKHSNKVHTCSQPYLLKMKQPQWNRSCVLCSVKAGSDLLEILKCHSLIELSCHFSQDSRKNQNPNKQNSNPQSKQGWGWERGRIDSGTHLIDSGTHKIDSGSFNGRSRHLLAGHGTLYRSRYPIQQKAASTTARNMDRSKGSLSNTGPQLDIHQDRAAAMHLHPKQQYSKSGLRPRVSEDSTQGIDTKRKMIFERLGEGSFYSFRLG
jgi:hypothetical protein